MRTDRSETGRPGGGRPEADRTLDVRDVDGEPFEHIVAELERLPADESLLLVNGFEPEPLYAVLDRRGFEREATADRENGSEVWYVEIRHA
ncbi:DUF2249 domain-containing protein [Halorubrum halodurans]|uniref:DUF2249 domain-containing protein n=1 Tax=Halorubrum halodurans TaxID=1383851 RepID=A0A256IC49_9EURY|nr:DUF2249 domain-containing protein [Halorubrum halodurans]OYR54119.1 hypothetical protein DJ70_14860 [Halorubrum halodurans]